MMRQQPTLPDTAAPDAAWLAQVRADAGRWWATFDPAPDLAPPLAWGATDDGWIVTHRATGTALGGRWPSPDAAKLWLWLALGTASWHLSDAPDRTIREFRDDLAAAERRLRAALGLAAGQ